MWPLFIEALLTFSYSLILVEVDMTVDITRIRFRLDPDRNAIKMDGVKELEPSRSFTASTAASLLEYGLSPNSIASRAFIRMRRQDLGNPDIPIKTILKD